MTEYTNIQTIEAFLASVVLPYGNSLPAPVVVISDDTPLYDEPEVLKEMDDAMIESRNAKVIAQITDVTEYNPSLLTVTFTAKGFDKTYRVNVPRQLLQVGYMYNRLLHAPAFALITESEALLNTELDFDDESTVKGASMPPFLSEDFLVRLEFPADLSQSTRMAYNQIMNNMPVDFTEGVSKEELRDISSKIQVMITPVESRAIRADMIEMLLGLVEGKQDAFFQLYDYANAVDASKEAVMKNALLTDEERKAAVVFEFLAQIVYCVQPDVLISRLKEIHDIEDSEDNDNSELAEALDSLFSDDLSSSLAEIANEFRQNNPEAITVNKDSTFEERVEYMSLPSNQVPLMGGLKEQSEQWNTKLYYSSNWNREEITEEEYGTRGEFMIILTMLVLQRIQMFAKTLDLPDEVQQTKALALSVLIDSLTSEHESEQWYLMEALLRASKGNSHPLEQSLIVSLAEPMSVEISALMHWFGHILLEENYTEKQLLKMFAGMPMMCSYVSTLFEVAADADDDEDDSGCMVAEDASSVRLDNLDDDNMFAFGREVTSALLILAEDLLEKDAKAAGIERESKEWQEAYLSQLIRFVNEQ